MTGWFQRSELAFHIYFQLSGSVKFHQTQQSVSTSPVLFGRWISNESSDIWPTIFCLLYIIIYYFFLLYFLSNYSEFLIILAWLCHNIRATWGKKKTWKKSVLTINFKIALKKQTQTSIIGSQYHPYPIFFFEH
jgi:hypothetical protein